MMAKKKVAGDKPQTFDESNGQYTKDAKRAEAERIYDTVGDITPTGIQSKAEQAYGFVDKDRKNTAHHKNHAKEMGFKNQDEYEEEAIKFWEIGVGTIYQGKRRNDFAKYNKKTNEYVVVSKDGYIKTFYKMALKKFIDKVKQEGYVEWKK